MFRGKSFQTNIFLILFIVSFCSFGISTLAYASGVPSILSYTGRLTDSGGNPLGAGGGTTYYFKFSIWDSSTIGSGTKLWPTGAPGSGTSTVKQGSFSVNIGDTDNGYPDALDYDFNTNSNIYLQVEVSSDNSTFETLAPRSKISSTAFSQIASRVSGTADSSFGTTTPFLNTLISAISTSVNKAVMTIKGMAGQVANLFNIKDSNDNTLFTVTADGNVGIGTVSPRGKLDVSGTTDITWGLNSSGLVTVGDIGPSGGSLFVNTGSNHPAFSSGLGVTGDYDTPNSSGQVRLSAYGPYGAGYGSNLIFSTTNGTSLNEAMRIDKNGYVGIGTTTPSAKLHITGTAGSADIFAVSSSTNSRLFTIGANGNVGIGKMSPTSALTFSSVNGANMIDFRDSAFNQSRLSLSLDSGGNGNIYSYNSGFVFNAGNPANGYAYDFRLANSSILRIGYSNIGIGTTTPSAKLHITGTAGSADIFAVSSSTNSRLFTIGANGNVGIGTVSPRGKLDVSGTTDITWGLNSSGLVTVGDIGPSGGSLFVNTGSNHPAFSSGLGVTGDYDTPNSSGQVRLSAYGPYGAGYNSNLIFSTTNGTSLNEAMRIDKNGYVGIGTTTPSAKLHITGTAGSADIFAVSSSTNSRLFTIGANGNVGIGTTTPTEKLTVVGNAQFTGVGSGVNAYDLGITAEGVLTTAASDQRLKQNILTIDSVSTLEKLSQLKPSSFEWKSNNSSDIGLIAQEVEQIFPELVFTNPTDGYKGINYSRFITLLISGVQELNNKVNKIFSWFKDDKLNIQNDVCVDDVCITKEQFKTILENGGANSVGNSTSNPSNFADSTIDATSTESISSEPAEIPASPSEPEVIPEIVEETAPIEETPVSEDTSTLDLSEETAPTIESISQTAPTEVPTPIPEAEAQESV